MTILDEESDIVLMVGNAYAVAAILTDIIATPLFKIKENNGVPIIGQDGMPKFEINDDGSKILNKNNMTKVIGDSNRSVEQFRQ